MKNIHIIPTDKPSSYVTNYMEQSMQFHNIYIISDEEIKEGDWVYYLHNSGLHEPRIMEVIKPNYSDYKPYSIHFKSGFGVQKDCKKIILTTDQDLIKDGVQAIDDEFLEWFVKNPSCEEIGVTFECMETRQCMCDSNARCLKPGYQIIIPEEEPKQETLEEVKPHSFCETPYEKCTMNYCDENGCQNRKKELVEPKEEPKQETLEEIKLEPLYGSSYCQFSVIENQLATLYRNQEKILTAIKLLNNGKQRNT
jgi:hypothetical protein